MRSPVRCLALLVGLLAPAVLAAQGAPSDSVRVERLAALGRLWGAVKFFHPALASGGVDWDSALVAAIPKVRAAGSADEYAAAVDGMLAALGDPATHVVRTSPRGAAPAAARQSQSRWTDDSVLVVTVTDYDNFMPAYGLMTRLGGDLARARRVVFDLRTHDRANESGALAYLFDASGAAARLTAEPLVGPAERQRQHSGFAPQSGGTSGGYFSGWRVKDGPVFRPPASVVDKRVAFVINANSEVPLVALALQDAGRASIVAEGAGAAASLPGSTSRIALSDSVQALVRTGEILRRDGSTTFRPDTTLAAPASPTYAAFESDAAIQTALSLVRSPRSKATGSPVAASSLAPAIPPAERAYAEMRYPALEYRLLGAFRIWSTMQYFFPYRQLMGEDWGAVLRAYVPRMEGTRDSLEYALAVSEMVTHLHDTHVGATGPALVAYLGQASTGVRVRYVEGVPVVAQITTDSLVPTPGIQLGDVILSVDGEDAAARRARLARYLTASTPQALDALVAGSLLRGPAASVAVLRVRGRDGRVREARLPRSIGRQLWPSWRTEPVLRLLPGNVGYADLERLTTAMVDSMFEMFKDTKAIVLDMRGYPQGTAWAIAPRLAARDGVVGARFRRPLATSPDTTEWTTYEFTQAIPPTTKPRYRGRTVMLIDERAVSQAEHTGLFFEAANGTKFVGSPTMGANGDVTNFYIPGGILVRFSGHDVRHADGRQLQRVGLVPDVPVKPTIAGIRAGRDEVLERALKYLATGK